MKLRDKIFDTKKHTYICGILNVTPDSFSDGGEWNSMDRALKHVEEMIQNGADIIDVGGESTRPGFVRISDGEEIKRTVPVIEKIRSNFDIPISIDTYKYAVAKAALEAGADMLNDITGLSWSLDHEIASNVRVAENDSGAEKIDGDADYPDFFKENNLAALSVQFDVPIVLTHNGKIVSDDSGDKDFLQEYLNRNREMAERALKLGVKAENIIIDPGVGFGKTVEENLFILNHLKELGELGFPTYLGASRKSVIKKTLFGEAKVNMKDVSVQKSLLTGTIVTSAAAAAARCAFVRVHDVKENYEAIKFMEAMRDTNL